VNAPAIDPEFRAIIPPLSDEEAAGLEENILAHGCRVPLDVWRGILLDGHHRLTVCEKHGIPFRTSEIYLPDRRAAMVWIAKNQRDRRNVTMYQRCELGFVIEENLPSRQGERADVTSGQKRPEVDKPSMAAPKAAGVKPTTYKKAKVIAKAAPENVKKKLRAGETTIGKVYADMEKAAKKAAKAEEKEKAEAQAATKYVAGTFDDVHPGEWWRLGRHVLYCGDTSSDEFANSCPMAALAFADPPYGAGVAEWDDVAVWDHDWLSGSAAVVAVTPGIASIFDFARKTSMPYKWSAACWINNGTARGALGFGNWIYVALFADGTIHRGAQDFAQVSIDLADYDEKKHHKGRKPTGLITYLLQTFTKKGDAVIDPFAGSGTTLIACESIGRACVTGDIDPGFCRDIILRWQGVTGEVATRG
jgi:16S rRNA G966 N2-methylase RsmD